MMMVDAQHHHAAKMAKGEIDYQGKLLEARQWTGKTSCFGR